MDGKHLLLGGCGFVGRHVAMLLARQGHEVIVADRLPPPNDLPPELRERMSWRAFDLEGAPWDEMLDGVAVVHHYAWNSIPATANDSPIGDLMANVGPTISLLEAIRRREKDLPRVVFSSSGGTVYGKLQRVPVDENHPLNPLNAYGSGKAAAELYICAYRNQYGIDCRVARLANPFGAGQNPMRGQGAVTTFLHRALQHEPIVIWGDGEVVRDYIHVADAAAGLAKLACTADVGEQHVFNIGSGVGVSLNAIIAQLESALGRRLEVRREGARPYDVPISVLDISSMNDIVDWRPWLNFSDGIRRTLTDMERGRSFSTLD